MRASLTEAVTGGALPADLDVDLAVLFPGTAIHDPEFTGTTIIGLHPQVLLAVILLAVLAAAVALSGSAEH